jgi:deoxyribodipyrimidine photolyase-related protein
MIQYMKKILLLYPHQLFPLDESTIDWSSIDRVVLVEEYLMFRQYRFHKQKIALHRASMKHYEQQLQEMGIKTLYIESSELSDSKAVFTVLKNVNVSEIIVYNVVDDYLARAIDEAREMFDITILDTPMFLCSDKECKDYAEKKKGKRLLMADFYKLQRHRLNILIDNNGEAVGGQYSFDAENRKKIPKGTELPVQYAIAVSQYWIDAVLYTEKNFPNNYGSVDADTQLYAISTDQAVLSLKDFLENRFSSFGPYEDAMHTDASVLWHSNLSSSLNIGLVTPQYIVNSAVAYAEKNSIDIASVEGFIRQIIGWREFMRLVYTVHGRQQRVTNFWKHTKRVPEDWWKGSTGIYPIDTVIQRLLETAYSHHIERLMLLGNTMLLSEFHPNSVYKWFMEMYIDAYDWVMVPNVYGMSQFADGGLFATKPYICGSNYIVKMSNYKKGDWCIVLDTLFWDFMKKHRVFLSKNPRLAMLLKRFD